MPSFDLIDGPHITSLKLLLLMPGGTTRKGMRTDEAYMFVGYDSREDGRPRCTPHTAFQDPNTSPDAPIRHSIEFRTLAFWDS